MDLGEYRRGEDSDTCRSTNEIILVVSLIHIDIEIRITCPVNHNVQYIVCIYIVYICVGVCQNIMAFVLEFIQIFKKITILNSCSSFKVRGGYFFHSICFVL